MTHYGVLTNHLRCFISYQYRYFSCSD